MAKKTKKAKAAQRRKTFRQQGVEAFNKELSKGYLVEEERSTFLLGYEKGVKAHQTQRDTDGKPSEKECKQAVKVLREMRDAAKRDAVGSNSETPEGVETLPVVVAANKAIVGLGGKP